MNIKSFESRSAKPVLVKLTSSDRKRLKKQAERYEMPMATLAYAVISAWLDEQDHKKGGAQ